MSDQSRTITFEPRNIWRIGWVVIALVGVFLLLRFFIADGGSVIFILLMSWFASLAMEPAVRRLAKHMKRGLATGVVMIGLMLFGALFMVSFGKLFVDQIAQLLQGLPHLVDQLVAWINQKAGTDYKLNDILQQLNIQPSQVAGYASQVVGGVLGLLGTVVGGFFSIFTLGLFTFYFSADGPRFRRYVASLFPQSMQAGAVQIWDLTAEKTGNYVAARVILATINAATTAIVFVVIGMPSWLALAIWTGVVAQFVPTIGTYIAIALPVLVGLLSGNPWIGIIALAWGILYQQVENLTIEPRISARAVDVHPAVAFAAVMLGAALFGVAGALLAIPVIAMILSLAEARHARFDVIPELQDPTTP